MQSIEMIGYKSVGVKAKLKALIGGLTLLDSPEMSKVTKGVLVQLPAKYLAQESRGGKTQRLNWKGYNLTKRLGTIYRLNG